LKFEKLNNYEKSYKEFLEAIEFYPDINWRWIIRPTKKLPSTDLPYEYTQKQIEQII